MNISKRRLREREIEIYEQLIKDICSPETINAHFTSKDIKVFAAELKQYLLDKISNIKAKQAGKDK